MPKLNRVEVVEPYFLRLYYETGEIKLFDVFPYISGSWYGELREWSYFQTVKLASDRNGIEWSHGQDIAPHELYENGILDMKKTLL